MFSEFNRPVDESGGEDRRQEKQISQWGRQLLSTMGKNRKAIKTG